MKICGVLLVERNMSFVIREFFSKLSELKLEMIYEYYLWCLYYFPMNSSNRLIKALEEN
jgi:hypothetical protein